MLTLKQAASEIQDAEKIVITAHVHPDGDAIGSTLGLFSIVRAMGKEAVAFIDDENPRVFRILPGIEEIHRPEGSMISCDLLIVLDTMTDRIGAVLEQVKPKAVLNIDHHHTNQGIEGEDLYLDASCAATAEIICHLAELLKHPVSEGEAFCLYTGMATDTGFFRFSNTTPDTMRAAASMIENGARPNVLSEALESKPLQSVKDLSEALGQMEAFADGRAMGIFLTQEQTSRMEDTQSFLSHIRVIEGIEVAVLMKCMEEKVCRISMRSKGVDVSEIAVGFGGGGHARAAGCTLLLPYEEAKRTIKAAVEKALLSSASVQMER